MQERESEGTGFLSYHPPIRRNRTTWQPFLEEPLRAQAQEVALFVAGRMCDPAYVAKMAELSRKQAIYPSIWLPTDLASGEVGVALMYASVDACFPGQGWDALARQYLRIAAAGTQQSTLISPGLLNGAAGLAFTIMQASRGGTRYQQTLSSLNKDLCARVLSQPWWRPEREWGVSFTDIDLVSGAAGILVYLVSLEQPDTCVQMAIAHLLAYLLWLGEPGQPLGQERWYIPPELLPSDLHRQAFPQGSFNCGLAHGIPGPLAALSLTWLAGYHYPGLHETIAYLANWVAVHRIEQEWGIDWPASVPLQCATSESEWQHLPPARASWCYGTPGVARSLWLAGCALEREELRRLAVEAIEAALRRPLAQRDIRSPVLCHGTAGLLHICLRFAQESASDLVNMQIPLLTEQVLAVFDPSFPLGFRNTDHENPRDHPGWLAGAPGIVLSLLAAATDVTPSWDRVLAIA